MTHDPITGAMSGVRLWVRSDDLPHHWHMVVVGDRLEVERVFADVGIHFPDYERLILPASQKPCGKPKPCEVCGDRAVANRRPLCQACLDQSKT